MADPDQLHFNPAGSCVSYGEGQGVMYGKDVQNHAAKGVFECEAHSAYSGMTFSRLLQKFWRNPYLTALGMICKPRVSWLVERLSRGVLECVHLARWVLDPCRRRRDTRLAHYAHSGQRIWCAANFGRIHCREESASSVKGFKR